MPGLSDALALARMGFRVFPVHGVVAGRCDCGKVDCGSPGKHPMVKDWQTVASCDETEVTALFRNRPTANIGLVTGNGLIVVDVDGDEGHATLASWEAEHGPLPVTPQVITGGGGTHFYFYCAEAIRNSASRIGHKIDIRADGGYVIAPGSVHANGRAYTWAPGRSPDEC